MDSLNEIVTKIDDFVWGPVMLILLVGTGIFLTVRTRFLTSVPEISSVLPQPWFPVVPELWYGCGFPQPSV